ncbi:recombination repair protein 1 isoform X4 [Drosophila elegans]|uniref:recombination repair protein 1 isoform X4 n=1 Tax=Drosophila elegans TaxID=30023 RepID=UPI0007E88695|nr:recombination repair protein 1 isoform X4 [Drosophila elegans]
MPRIKTTKKQAEAVASEPSDPTPNGNVADENQAADPASAAGEVKVPGKGKPRLKKAIKAPVEMENSAEVEAEKAPTAAARGKKKQQPKDTEENGEAKVVVKPKGRAKKATAEEPPAGKVTKSRAKIEATPAAEEEASANSKGRTKIEKPTEVQEPKARGRKRKDPSAEANGISDEPAEPPKRRTKKEAAPAIEEEPQPLAPPKEKAQKTEPAAKRARGTKRLADSEITAALEEAEVDEEPPKAASKGTKKGKAVKMETETEVDSDLVSEELEAPPKAAAKKRTKKETEPKAKTTKQSAKAIKTEPEPVGDAELVSEELEAPPKAATKKRTKKETEPKANPTKKEELPAPVKKRGRKASADKENGVATEIEPLAESKPVRNRKKAASKVEDAEDDDEVGSKSMLAEQSGCGGAAVLKSLQNMLNFCFPAAKTAKKAEGKSNGTLDKDAFALPADKEFNLKISSWNVAGLRAWLKKDGLQIIDLEEPDIFCLQETKCANEQLPEEVTRLPGYHPYWLCMPGGYAGVAIYSKIMPINVEYGIGNEEFDDVGRMITAEYEKFYLINVYVPNSGRKLVNLEPRMRWEKSFQAHVQKLDALKPVVICGDMNVSHMPIDLENPKTNTKNAGFTQEERDKMTELLGLGFVDTFRHLYPDRKGAYTFWTYMANARARNVGWRLDYCLVSERFVPKVVEHEIRSQCLGSDHCPITIFFNV